MIALIAVVSGIGAEAHAKPGKRSVAVLEFRQGVSALPWLADSLARRLRALTGLQVLGPTEARQKLGDQVDSFVARCQGAPRCVGAIGAKLGVSEVILIGMSSLGDVIIQISRVDASSRAVLGSVGHTLSPTAELTRQSLDGILRRLMPPRDFIRYGFIRVQSNQPKADVFLDNKKRGQTPLPGPIKVRAPSSHSIKVIKKGYVDFSARLNVPPEGTILVNAKLPPIPKELTPYYKKWWFWTVLASSVAVVAAVSAGVALTLTKAPDNVPAVIRW